MRTSRLLVVALALVARGQSPDGNFRIALTGDSIIERRLSVYDDPGYLQMIEGIRTADAAFTNFEMLVHNFEFAGAPVSGGTYMGAPPWVIDELKWAGFRLFATANNHSFDFGTEGLLSNIRHLEQAGVVFAGTGENLARARAPAYLDTPKGRIALISCTSTFSPLSPAGEQRPDLKGRPGLNPLRFKTTYIVEPATLETIRQLARMGSSAPAEGTRDTVRFLGATFRAGDKPGIKTEPDPRDLAGILAGIREARRQADWVVVSIHAHEGAPGDREKPAEFLAAFAHAAIDAGADVFVGHGPHVLRGIEIYKGKPIFYSLANFVFENDLVPFQPQENYDSMNLPLTATPADFYDARSNNDTRSFPADREMWESVVAQATFNSKREVIKIELQPIVLGFHQSRTHRGRPVPATGDAATSILDRVAKVSASFGTSIEIRQGIGVVDLQRAAVQPRQ